MWFFSWNIAIYGFITFILVEAANSIRNESLWTLSIEMCNDFVHICTCSYAFWVSLHHKHVNVIEVPNIMQNMPNVVYVSLAIQKPSPFAWYPAHVRKWKQKVLTYDSLQLPQPYFRKFITIINIATADLFMLICIFFHFLEFTNDRAVTLLITPRLSSREKKEARRWKSNSS